MSQIFAFIIAIGMLCTALHLFVALLRWNASDYRAKGISEGIEQTRAYYAGYLEFISKVLDQRKEDLERARHEGFINGQGHPHRAANGQFIRMEK